MIFSKTAVGWAPITGTPLMTNAGVPVTPIACPSEKGSVALFDPGHAEAGPAACAGQIVALSSSSAVASRNSCGASTASA